MFKPKPLKPVFCKFAFSTFRSLQGIFNVAFEKVQNNVFGSKAGVWLIASLLLFITWLPLHNPTQAQAATPTLNFQARLENGSGAIVPDNNYNIEFKLYDSTTGGTALWTEDYLNSASQGVRIANGYLSVNLGSITSFPSTINWDDDLYLSMNIGGTANSVGPSLSDPAPWDGEMSPRLKLTAVPYAFQAQSAHQLQAIQGGYTGTLDFGNLTADRRFVLPDTSLATTSSPGTICVFNGAISNCPAATGSAYYIHNDTGLQTSANFNIQGKDNGTDGSVVGVLQGAAGGQTVDLLQFKDTSGAVVASVSAGGDLKVAGSVDTQTGTSLSLGTTNATSILIGQSGITTEIQGNTKVTLDTASAGSTPVCQNADGNLSSCDSSVAGSYIQNQSTAAQTTANFWIDGTGHANTLQADTTVQTPELDTATATALGIGTTNATDVTIGHGAGTIAIDGTNFNLSTAGVLTLAGGQVADITTDGATSLSIDTGGAAAINLGATNANAINIAQSGVVTTVNGSLEVKELLTGDAGLTVSGGAISLTGNTDSSLATSTGTLTITSDQAATWSTTNGDLTLQAGSGTVSLGSSTMLTASGALSLTSGGANTLTVDTGGAAVLSLGTTNANAISIGQAGVTTTNNGALTVTEALTGNAGITIGGGAVSLTGTTDSTLQTSSGALTLTSATAATWSTTAGDLTLQAGGTSALNLDTGGAGTVNVGTSNSTAINIGNSGSLTTIAGNTAVTLNPTTATGMVCQNTATGVLSACDATYQAPTATNFIQNQSTAAQTTANFWIDGTGHANTLQADTTVQTPELDTATAAALGIGTTNATDILLGHNAGTLAIDATNIDLSTTGTLTLAGGQAIDLSSNGATTLTVDTGGAAALNLGTTNANAVNIATAGVATTVNGSLEVKQTTTFDDNVTVVAGKTLTITGDTTANRATDIPSPTEGMLFYDTTTHRLLVYNGTKWQANGSEAVLVAASNSSQTDKDAADYVATGTGDQATINTALAAAAGGKVYLFAGTYTVNGSISVPDNTTLSGAGSGTVVQFANLGGGDADMIVNSDTAGGTGVTVRDMKLDGRSDLNTTGTQHAVHLQGMGNAAANRLGGLLTGLQSQGFSTGAVIYLDNAANTNIASNAITNSQVGVYLANGSTNNTVTGNAANNVAIGFDADTSTGNTITGNTVTTATIGAYYLSNGASDNTITGNTASSTHDGIVVDGSNNNTVSGNAVTGNSLYGIYVGNASSNTITGNTVSDSGGATANNGIYLNTNASSNTITGNTITDGTHSSTNYAINITSSAANNYLSNNTLGSGTINDTATGTIYGGQTDGSSNYIIQPAGGAIDLNANTNITGNLTVTGSIDSATAVTLSIGTATASAVTIGHAGITTTIAGNTAVTLNPTTATGMVCQNTATGVLSACDATYQAPTATNFIQNQSTAAQTTANFWIDGTGHANTLQADTGMTTPSVDALAAGTLSVGTANATSITIGHTGITTTNNGALTVTQLLTGNAGATISGAAINLNASSNYATNINTGTSTGTVNIGNAAAGAITLQSGGAISLTGGANSSFVTGSGSKLTLTSGAATTWSTTAGDLTIQAAGTSALNLNTSGAGTVNVGTANTTKVNIGSTSATQVVLQAGSASGNGVAIQSSSATALQVQTSGGGTTLLTADASGTRRVTVGTVGTVYGTTSANGDLVVSGNAEVQGYLYVGSSTSDAVYTSSAAGGALRFKGSARNSVTATLVPEYPGAVMTGDGTNNVGIMTSDFCSAPLGVNAGAGSACANAGEEHNYYSWTDSSQPSTAQDYDLYVRWQVPSNYDSTAAPSISFYGWHTTASDSVAVTLYSGGTACGTGTVASGTTGAWTTASVSTGSCTLTPGSVVTFKIHLVATMGNYSRVGEIGIVYRTVF